MTGQYRSAVAASIHETADEPHAAGVMDKHTMLKFDMLKFDDVRLPPVRPLSAEEIRALRERECEEWRYIRSFNMAGSSAHQYADRRSICAPDMARGTGRR